MANNINVLEVLESKPNGTKLWCVLFGKCFLDGIDINNIRPIRIGIEKGDTFKLTANAKLGGKYIDGDCLLYPSKEMRDWSRFAWKNGDILISSDGGAEVIFNKWYDDTYTSFYCKHYLNSEDKNKIVYYEEFLCTTARYSLEDKDTVQTYIKTIEERLGGKLNRETLEIEKPEFKDGDIAFADYGNRQDVFIVSDKTDLSEGYSSFISLDLNSLTLSIGCRTTFFKKDLCKLRIATESEKQQLFSALEKEGKAWDAEKKMIVGLPPKFDELKPFDKVLVRDDKEEQWFASIFSYRHRDMYYCLGECYRYCIPYEGNEKLLGTMDDVSEKHLKINMNRVIKFKAKGLDDRDWKEGNLVVTDLIGCDGPITEIITTDEMRYEVDPSTICQFTGLKDCDGKEIWEGDIVIRYSDQGDITAYVVWEMKVAVIH